MQGKRETKEANWKNASSKGDKKAIMPNVRELANKKATKQARKLQQYYLLLKEESKNANRRNKCKTRLEKK